MRATSIGARLRPLSIALGSALAMCAGVAALPVTATGASPSAPRPQHLKPAQLLASSKPYFHRFIVKYRDDSSEQRDGQMRQLSLDLAMARTGIIDSKSRSTGMAVAAHAPRISTLHRTGTGADAVSVERKLTVAETAALLAALRQDPQVEYAQIDRMKRAAYVPNDPMWSQLWGLSDPTHGINVASAWNTTRGQGQVVAVIDTGISNHPDLQANIIQGYDFISDPDVSHDGDGRDGDPTDNGDWNDVADDCDVSDSSWHGTHVAGTIAAIGGNGTGVVGVAHGAKVMPLRVLGRCGGYTSDINDAITWASGGTVAGVPNNTHRAKTINMSLGGTGGCGPDDQAAIDAAIARGTTVVVAAGNESSDVSTSDPANCHGVIAVAAIDRLGHLASFSNRGAGISVSAPGVSIYSTANAGATTATAPNYPAYSGTSMASPHVAGTVALMQAAAGAHPRSPADIKEMLEETAKPFTSPCGSCGSGVVNATAAVALAKVGLPRTLSENVGTPVSGGAGAVLRYRIAVPAEAHNLRVTLNGGTGNPDLYVRYAAEPTTTRYNCRPYHNAGVTESCLSTVPAAGYWYVDVIGRTAFSRAYLRATFDVPTDITAPTHLTNLAANAGGTLRYRLYVPYNAKNLVIQTSGGNGNSDLYVRHGSSATGATYDCRSAHARGLDDTCTIDAPAWGDWYVSLVPRTRFGNVTLNASYTEPLTRTYTNNTDYAITDNHTTSSAVKANGRAGNASPTMKVAVVIRHTYVGDLLIELVGPDGQAYPISDHGFGDQVDLLQTFTVDASASPATGVWKLRVTDTGPGDEGKIDSWSLTF